MLLYSVTQQPVQIPCEQSSLVQGTVEVDQRVVNFFVTRRNLCVLVTITLHGIAHLPEPGLHGTLVHGHSAAQVRRPKRRQALLQVVQRRLLAGLGPFLRAAVTQLQSARRGEARGLVDLEGACTTDIRFGICQDG